MLSTLLRPFGVGLHVEEERDPSPHPVNRTPVHIRHATADFTEADDDDDDSLDDGGQRTFRNLENGEEEDEDGSRHSQVLPLFSSSHLDSLPIYSLVHSIRIIIQARTETTLTWEQLRSPQVSQFLVKPMQQQIRTQHFSKATLYALMANCLQFSKEGQFYPGNAGTSSTRAKVCELLAIKLLKEYSTRDLIDALSYDFYPLQGLSGNQTPMTPRDGMGKQRSAAARTSTLEVAIRTSAKHFLAHPMVVQQLEAIWNGAISFYSSADSLHRREPVPPGSRWSRRNSNDPRTPLLGQQHVKEDQIWLQNFPPGRRTATLYDPRNASLMKLSRLRVPRYRQFLSTCSLAILIGLFLAVLVERSTHITSLELIFWFWSAGFMLDELVGFNEQGFSLYIMSFWNIFDLGILLLLIVFYLMRLYGVFFLVDAHRWNEYAYDVLAANAILLLPRIFSVLDHYRYFSQLLIAFRLMAVDLAAVFILILISCSGFFVFFTLSRNENDAGEVAFKIFQILMGFTPAAWEVWPEYDWLGRILMALFLIICHFVVVTILITVLTNSFMTIASNANEEHQFLFAINTISMVKNDALFSYVAPSNIVAWVLMPLRYCMPLRQFVAFNRYVIKCTHFPLLFSIYFYERFFLAPYVYEPTDLVENPSRGRHRILSFADPTSRAALFSPNVRVREESIVGYQKDRALEEVFRRAPDMATLRTQRRNERRKTQTAIRNWMDHNEDFADSPNNYSTIDSRTGHEWHRRLSMNKDRVPRRFRQLSEVRSTASDPADLLSHAALPTGQMQYNDGVSRRDHAQIKDNTDADGDDEFVTNDEDEEDDAADRAGSNQPAEDYFTTPIPARFGNLLDLPGKSPVVHASPKPGPSRRGLHSRTLSTNTILYNPPDEARQPKSSSSSPKPSSLPRSRMQSSRTTPAATPAATTAGHRSPRRSVYLTRPRPIMPPRDQIHTAPSRAALGIPIDTPVRRAQRRLSSFDLGNDVHSDLASAVGHGGDDAFGAVPSSFVTQMAMATGMMGPLGHRNAQGSQGSGDGDRMSRLVLARMKTLEESFTDVVREMRALQRRSGLPSTANTSGDDGSVGRGSGLATIEVAGRDRPRGEASGVRRAKSTTTKSGGKRPPSRLSMREEKVGLGRERDKGKAVQQFDDNDSDDEAEHVSFARRGSSL